MKRMIMFTGLCAGMLALAAGVQAQRQGAMPSFESLDTNEDGKLSLEEFKKMPIPREGMHERIFQMKDTDKDGFLSKIEFSKRPEGRGGRSR